MFNPFILGLKFNIFIVIFKILFTTLFFLFSYLPQDLFNYYVSLYYKVCVTDQFYQLTQFKLASCGVSLLLKELFKKQWEGLRKTKKLVRKGLSFNPYP